MAHPDLDQLLNASLEFAQTMLSKHGEFFPLGSSMNVEGQITMDGGDTGSEHPPSQGVIDLLTLAYKERAKHDQLRAAAICADVRVTPPGDREKTDAISVSLEHRSGEAVTVFLPYIKSSLGSITYGQIFASAQEAMFFHRRN